MRLRWLVLALLVVVTGCAAPPVDPAATPRFGQILARFVAGHDDQVIEISTLDRVAIRRAVLVMPGGARVPAYSIDAGVPADTPTPGGLVPGSPIDDARTATVGQTLSVALIRVPDPDDYAHGWQAARIAVDLGEGADARRLVLAAPAPL
jgi:hypothetical protein